MLKLGLDVGSTTIKCVVLDEDNNYKFVFSLGKGKENLFNKNEEGKDMPKFVMKNSHMLTLLFVDDIIADMVSAKIYKSPDEALVTKLDETAKVIDGETAVDLENKPVNDNSLTGALARAAAQMEQQQRRPQRQDRTSTAHRLRALGDHCRVDRCRD